jgi:hypothetical protein
MLPEYSNLTNNTARSEDFSDTAKFQVQSAGWCLDCNLCQVSIDQPESRLPRASAGTEDILGTDSKQRKSLYLGQNANGAYDWRWFTNRGAVDLTLTAKSLDPDSMKWEASMVGAPSGFIAHMDNQEMIAVRTASHHNGEPMTVEGCAQRSGVMCAGEAAGWSHLVILQPA